VATGHRAASLSLLAGAAKADRHSERAAFNADEQRSCIAERGVVLYAVRRPRSSKNLYDRHTGGRLGESAAPGAAESWEKRDAQGVGTPRGRREMTRGSCGRCHATRGSAKRPRTAQQQPASWGRPTRLGTEGPHAAYLYWPDTQGELRGVVMSAEQLNCKRRPTRSDSELVARGRAEGSRAAESSWLHMAWCSKRAAGAPGLPMGRRASDLG